jgi:hypothetical protein
MCESVELTSKVCKNFRPVETVPPEEPAVFVKVPKLRLHLPCTIDFVTVLENAISSLL